MKQLEEQSLFDKLNISLSDNDRNKLDLKIVEALFDILYKKELVNKKEYNSLIAHLNRKLQEIQK